MTDEKKMEEKRKLVKSYVTEDGALVEEFVGPNKPEHTTFVINRGTKIDIDFPDVIVSPGLIPADVTNPAEMTVAMRPALREELKEYPYGASGLDYNILFAEKGYTIHYVENVVDPTDGLEKLVMFDPWTQYSAIIYNPLTREIEWEVVVPGTAHVNPHQGGMLMTSIAGFGNAGDIFCVDRDNNIIVIDRDTQAITFSQSTGLAPTLIDGIVIGIDNASILVANYAVAGAGWVAKLTLPGLVLVWQTVIPTASKLSVIQGAGEAPNPSFGGEYLAVSNWNIARGTADRYGVIYELRDTDGVIVWQNPNAAGVGTPVSSPHSAFRMGRTEGFGSITITGSEAGGDILGIDYSGRTVFGLSPAGYIDNGLILYRYNPYLLSEITCVFPLLNGRIGFSAWNGVNRSTVGEIVRFPEKQNVSYILAYGTTSTDAVSWRDPPIPAIAWQETLIAIKNTGGANSLDYSVDAYVSHHIGITDDLARGRLPDVFEGTILPGAYIEIDSIHPFIWLRVGISSTVGGNSTTYDVYVTQRK